VDGQNNQFEQETTLRVEDQRTIQPFLGGGFLGFLVKGSPLWCGLGGGGVWGGGSGGWGWGLGVHFLGVLLGLGGGLALGGGNPLGFFVGGGVEIRIPHGRGEPEPPS